MVNSIGNRMVNLDSNSASERTEFCLQKSGRKTLHLYANVTPTVAEGSKAYLLDFSAPLEMTGRVGFSEFTSLLIGTAIEDEARFRSWEMTYSNYLDSIFNRNVK